MFTNHQVNAILKWSFMEHYRPRIIDAELSRRLASKGAVLVEGPKWCGKTTSAIQVSKSAIRMDDPARSEQYIAMADIDPQQLIAGDVPRLIDEWQRAPKLWDAVRYEVDRRGKMGQFILTGSAVPPDEADMDEKHTGTGRISWATMRPMTLWESGESNGAVSLENLFSTPERIAGTSNRSLGNIAFSICRGGWPLAVDLDGEAALDQAIDYVDAVVHKDINRVDGVQKNPDRVRRVLRAYSRHQAQQVPYATLSADIAANEAQGTSDDTISQYASARPAGLRAGAARRGEAFPRQLGARMRCGRMPAGWLVRPRRGEARRRQTRRGRRCEPDRGRGEGRHVQDARPVIRDGAHRRGGVRFPPQGRRLRGADFLLEKLTLVRSYLPEHRAYFLTNYYMP